MLIGAVWIVLNAFPSYADRGRASAGYFSSNLSKIDQNFPEFPKLIDNKLEGGETVAFTDEHTKEFKRNFDVTYVDLTCGRLFFLHEKSLFGGYKRTFVMHKDIPRMCSPIILDNSESQKTQFKKISEHFAKERAASNEESNKANPE